MSILFHQYQPFPKPLEPVPTENVGTFCVEFDGKWIPYLLGAISTLAIDQTWKTDQYRATGEARNLMDTFMRAIACHIDAIQGVEMDDCMGCCIRWSEDGILQTFSCGEWVDVPGPGSQISINGPTTPKNPAPPTAGECQSFIGKVTFFGRWLLPSTVSSGDQITVTNADGITTDYLIDFPVYRCPDGTIFIISGCLTGSETFNGSDPAPAYHHGNLIGFDGTNYYDFGQAADAVPVTVTIPPGISDQNFVMMVNAPGPAGDGNIAFDIKICKAGAPPLTITYDFGTGPAAANFGDILTMSSQDVGSGNHVIEWTLSAPAKLTVTNQVGYVFTDTPGNNFFNWYNPPATNTGNMADPPNTSPTDFPANTLVQKIIVETGNGGAAFQIQCKLAAP